MVVPDVGYNKFLTPAPVGIDENLIVSITINFRKVLLINENENFIKIWASLEKMWYNSQLTYQNLKKEKDNQVYKDDIEMMFDPWIELVNKEDDGKCKKTKRHTTFKIIPNYSFNFTKNHYSNYFNAYLFEGSNNVLFKVSDSTCEVICEFNYYWYPFDTQNCPFVIKTPHRNLKIEADDVFYTGPSDLGKYHYENINFCYDNDGEQALLIDLVFKVLLH